MLQLAGHRQLSVKDMLIFLRRSILLKSFYFYRKNHPIHWDNLSSYKLPTFGATKTYYYGDEFENAKQQGLIKVQVANTDRINFRKLIGTRIDAFPVALAVRIRYVAAQILKATIYAIRVFLKTTIH